MMSSPPSSAPLRPRVALVGVSGYGRTHLAELLHLSKKGLVQITAAVSVDPVADAASLEQLGGTGCRVFPDLDSMLATFHGNLDLCCLPTPIATHAPFAIKALQAGSNVLIEKPATATLADARAVARAARLADRFAAVGFQQVYAPGNRALKAKLLNGAIGRVRRIHVLGLWPRPLAYFNRNSWVGRLRVNEEWVNDSPANNALAHFVNLALFFAGPTPNQVATPTTLKAERYRCQPVETFDTVVADVGTSTGVAIRLALSHSTATYAPVTLRIEGDTGQVEWTHCSGYSLTARDGAPEWHSVEDDDIARAHLFDLCVRRITDKTTPIYDIDDAAAHVLVIQALNLAGHPDRIPSSACQESSGPEAAISVPGLDQWLEAAHQSTRSLQELGCPWAQPPHHAPAHAWTATDPSGTSPSKQNLVC